MLDNAKEFGGLPIEDYSPDEGIQNPTGAAYRLRLDWEEYEQEKSLAGRLQTFLDDENVSMVPALVIGDWGGAGEGNSSAVVVEMHAPQRLSNFAGKTPLANQLMPAYTTTHSTQPNPHQPPSPGPPGPGTAPRAARKKTRDHDVDR